MRNAKSVARDILILRYGDEDAAELRRLTELTEKLDADISAGLLTNREMFTAAVTERTRGNETGKTAPALLNAVFKTASELKSVSMLGKILFAGNLADTDYALALLYRLLERAGLTIKVVPFGYDALRGGIAGNRLLEFTAPVPAVPARTLTQADLIKALFIMNGEPDEDLAYVTECPALLEYKKLADEAAGMADIRMAEIPDFTSYPNMALVMGLCAAFRSGQSVELRKESLERFVISIMSRRPT